MECAIPFSFPLLLLFLLCAIISPLIALGLAWALCTRRWRPLGKQACKIGGAMALVFIAAYLGVGVLLAEDTPFHPLSLAAAGGAGWTVGVIGACAWIWVSRRTLRMAGD